LNKNIIIVVLAIAVISLSFVVVLNDINQQHQEDLTEIYFQGRTDVLISIGQQLQQTGEVSVSIPVYDPETNTTVSVNVVLILEAGQ